MQKKVIITDFAQPIAERRSRDPKQIEHFIKEMFDLLQSSLRDDSLVKIKGLGTFKLVRVEPRESVNINTGQRFTIQQHTKVTFVPDAALRDQINKPFSEFQTVLLNPNVNLEDMERIDEEADNLQLDSIDSQEIEQSVAISEVTEPLPVDEQTKIQEEVVAEQVVDEISDGVPEAKVPVDTKEEESKDQESNLETKEVPQQVVVTDCPIEQHIEEQHVANQHIEHQTIETKQMNEESRNVSRLTIWEAMAMMLFVIVMMCLSYVAGYNHWLLNDNNIVVQQQQTEVKTTVSKKAETSPSPTRKTQPSKTDSVEQKEAAQKAVAPQPETPKANEYPQVENGTHEIVGVIEEHVVARGESLRGLSLKYYGSKDFVPYIVTMNKISNPDILQLGMTIKLPKLQKRSN